MTEDLDDWAMERMLKQVKVKKNILGFSVLRDQGREKAGDGCLKGGVSFFLPWP